MNNDVWCMICDICFIRCYIEREEIVIFSGDKFFNVGNDVFFICVLF